MRLFYNYCARTGSALMIVVTPRADPIESESPVLAVARRRIFVKLRIIGMSRVRIGGDPHAGGTLIDESDRFALVNSQSLR